MSPYYPAVSMRPWLTTVGGLVVGIITLFAYNYLVSQVDNVVNKMEARTMEFMGFIK